MSDFRVNINVPPFIKKPKFILTVLILIVAGFAFYSSFFIVNQQEQAIILRFGRYNRTMSAGAHFMLPFFIEQNYNVPTAKIFKEEFGYRPEEPGVQTRYSDLDFSYESIMLTGDLNIIDIEWSIQYRITDPRAWLFNVDDSDIVQNIVAAGGNIVTVVYENRIKTIRDISQAVINKQVGNRALFNILSDGDREALAQQVTDEMNRYFDLYRIGISVISTQWKGITPPAGEVYDAFEDVNRAQQDMRRFINEGKEQYNSEIPRADGEKLRIIEEARGYASERVNRAHGDVERFSAVLTQYRQSPQVMRDRLYIEMIEEIFGEQAGTLVDRNLDNFLPLKNLATGAGN